MPPLALSSRPGFVNKYSLASSAPLAVRLCCSLRALGGLGGEAFAFRGVLRALGGEAFVFLSALRGLGGKAFIFLGVPRVFAVQLFTESIFIGSRKIRG
jgi:hypothetical protein